MRNGFGNMVFFSTVFLAGFAFGVGSGMLAAPRSGAETRKRLRVLADETGEHADRIGQEAKRALSGIVEHGKSMMDETGGHFTAMSKATKETAANILDHGRELVR